MAPGVEGCPVWRLLQLHKLMPYLVGTTCPGRVCTGGESWLDAYLLREHVSFAEALRAQTTNQRGMTNKLCGSCRPTKSHEGILKLEPAG